MNSWVAWEEVNRLVMLQSMMRFAAFEMREGITPMHGLVQVMMSESRDEAEVRALRVLLAQLQGVEGLLKDLITAADGQKQPLEVAALEAARKSVRRLAEIHSSLEELHRQALEWQRDKDGERVQAMLQGLVLAKRLCGQLIDLA
ncbi:hypothetical protein CBW65_06200 [Tumebacillus avium]|uniref:Uncharacterized protein n=1 Tax=Tumebacillus avium TaxID=1903704 RepID=A0A1Y0IMZ1_9BACL|nr:hypothetical protein [Tumebacillus avium]ARU60723.1 hypothetical protein CBW65_06200 [Tumebacillus avium]